MKLSYGNVTATACLFVVLGGSSVAAPVRDAASRLITGKQVKDGSLTTKDVKNGSLLSADFKPGQVSAGAQGPKGDPGAPGDKGEKGDKGAPGPAAQPLVVDQTAVASPPVTTIATVGPWQITSYCSGDGTSAHWELGVRGPGQAQAAGIVSDQDDAAYTSPHTFGTDLGGTTSHTMVSGSAPEDGLFRRFAYTIVLNDANTSASLIVNVLADSRGTTSRCHGTGTAVVTG
jgi:hypothetical protein